MKAVLFDQVPEDCTRIKDQNRGFSIYGAAVHALESAKAILEYGTYAPDSCLLPAWAADRGEIVRPGAMQHLEGVNDVVILRTNLYRNCGYREPFNCGTQTLFQGFPSHILDDLQEVGLTEKGSW